MKSSMLLCLCKHFERRHIQELFNLLDFIKNSFGVTGLSVVSIQGQKYVNDFICDILTSGSTYGAVLRCSVVGRLIRLRLALWAK